MKALTTQQRETLRGMIERERKSKASPWLASYCPDAARLHTHDPKEPRGYIAWHEWAEKKNKTHRQERCPTCGLFAVWVPRRRKVAA